MIGMTNKVKVGIGLCLSFFAVTLIWFEIKEHASADIVLNEVCHSFSVAQHAIGDNYVELFNTTEEDIVLEGYYLLDDMELSNPLHLDTITIAGGEMAYIPIDENWDGMDFKPSSDGNIAEVFTLMLCDANGQVQDSVIVPQIRYNTSWGRTEDGGNNWNVMSATPGTSNNEAEILQLETLEAPVYSVESGFYGEEFLLELTTKEKDCTIYYTLDGSIPTEESIKYEEPIWIYNNSDEANLYASLKTICSGYIVEDFVFGSTTDENVDKCMIVRSAVYSNDGLQKSKVITKTYFVDEEGKYTDLPIVSLVSNPDGLFGYENGIYVTGKTFDEYVATAEELNPAVWSEWDTNYWQKGKEWEREAHIDYFNEEQELVLEQEVGIRIRGGQTRAYPQKSLNVYARSVYDKNEFDQPFFSNDTGRKRVTLATGGNDIDTKIRDALVYNLCSELEFATMETIPAYVFLNGEYWGLYHITEKYDEYYVEEHYGVLPEDVIMVKVEAAESGENAVAEYEIIDDYVDEKDLSDDAVYEEFLNYIDVESFLDYYAAQVYIARWGDWPSSNWTMWKSDEIKEDTPYYDGKWRYMIYDLNWADGCMSQWLVEHDTIAYLLEEDDFFGALMDNSQFHSAFLDRLSSMSTTVFENERVQEEISELASIVETGVKKDYERFYSGAKNADAFEWGINNIRVFFEQRGEFIARLVEMYR